MDSINVSTQAASHQTAPFALKSSLWEEWPEPLQYVSVPYRFSASSLGSPFRCPIRSFARASELHVAIGPGIPSLIGTAIHTMVERGIQTHSKTLRERIESLESVIKEHLERLPPAQRRGVLPLVGKYRDMAARSLAAASFWSIDSMNDGSVVRRDFPNGSNTCKAVKRQSSQWPRQRESSRLIEGNRSRGITS